MNNPNGLPLTPNAEPHDLATAAQETDQALRELTGGTFEGLSDEDKATLAEWGAEAREAHVEAMAVGRSALHEAGVSEPSGSSSSEDMQLVTVGGNMNVTRGALKRYEQEGQDMAAGTYANGRR